MPPKGLVLAFDTSAAHCAAALLSGDQVLAQRHEPMEKGQAERLMPMLAEMLAEAGVGFGDLARIGVGTGPGNFTGVRISVAAARGLALGLGIPAVGISALQAQALGMDGAQVGVFEETDQVSFSSLLKGEDSGALETEVVLELGSDFTDESLEGELADQELSRLLVSADLSESDSAGSVSVGLLDTASGRGALAGGLGGELLAGHFASGGLAGGLFSTSHF